MKVKRKAGMSKQTKAMRLKLAQYPKAIRGLRCDCGHTLEEHGQGCYAKVKGEFCLCRKTPAMIGVRKLTNEN